MSAGCKFALPVIPEDQAKAMREWETGSGSVFGGGFWTDAYLKDFVVKGDPAGMNGSDGTIVLGQMFFAMGDDKNPPPPPSEAAKHFPVGLRTETVAFPQDWFQLRFPALHKHPSSFALSCSICSPI